MTEYRTEIAIACWLSRDARSEIVARNGNRQIRTQTEFIAARRGGQVHAPANVLAGKVEKWFRWLQHRGRSTGVTGALIGGDQRLRPRVGPMPLSCYARAHHCPKNNCKSRVRGQPLAWRP